MERSRRDRSGSRERRERSRSDSHDRCDRSRSLQMLPRLFSMPSALVPVLRKLTAGDLLSIAATCSRVQDALAPALLEMSNGTLLPLWLPMSGNVHRRVLNVLQRVGIEDTEPSQESSVTPDIFAWASVASKTMQPVPEVEWRGGSSTLPTIDHGTPFLIREWATSQRWSAATDWAPCELYRRHGDAMLRCGEDGNGLDVRMRVADMLTYCVSRRSSSSTPLYLFDHEFDQQAPALLEGYAAPPQALVDGDLMELINERPPWRWFALGPTGAGLDAHQDPPHTSAWNVGVHGTKRWALLHPSLTGQAVGEGLLGDEEPTSVWFCTVLPKIAAHHPGKVFVVDAPPGSLLYVPPRWWHATWIISPVSVAITHNFVTWKAFYECWQHILRTNEERHRLFALSEAFGLTGSAMAAEWLRAIAAAARAQERPPPVSSDEVLRAYDEETGSGLPDIAWRVEDNAILTGMTGELSSIGFGV